MHFIDFFIHFIDVYCVIYLIINVLTKFTKMDEIIVH